MTSEHHLDPLDREIIERAFDTAWAAIKDSGTALDYERRGARGRFATRANWHRARQ